MNVLALQHVEFESVGMIADWLGAQLIASVLGAKVYPNPAKEIGWFPVAIIDEALSEPVLRGRTLR